MIKDNDLQKLSHSDIYRLLERIYGIHGDIDEVIETHLDAAISEPEGDDSLTRNLTQRLKQVARESYFVDYRESYNFSCHLRNLLLDINTLQRERDPVKALDLTNQFLQLIEPVMNRVDDSDGNVGDVFREATDQWLDIAAEVRASQPAHLDWVGRLRDYFDHNDYGCLDDIIAHSHKLLTKAELQQFARDFLQQAQQALAAPSIDAARSYNFAASHACIGLRSVAEALGDMAMFEQATLLTSPEPNALQMADLTEYAISIQDYTRADYWLALPGWGSHRYRQRELIRNLLELQGKTKELKLTLKGDFEQAPGMNTLQPYWEKASAEEKSRIAAQVEKLTTQWAEQNHRLWETVQLLLHVGSYSAAGEHVLAHPNSVESQSYWSLLPWAETFEKEEQPLAAVTCYRALLNDILDDGRSKAYRHAARYFHKLLVLDKQVQDYQELVDAQTFIRQIQQRHWRKRSFWDKADFPNKAT